MNIAIVFTGGTIGSCIKEDGLIGQWQQSGYLLLSIYKQNCGCPHHFETYEPYRILSENLNSGHLLMLVRCIQDLLKREDLDGIVITHGTDTLAYTASILQYIFGAAALPILLVSSDYVLTDARANGFINFKSAIRFIEEKAGNGVFVSYCNQNQTPLIHRGTRLQNTISYSADVDSILHTNYGSFQKEQFVKNPSYQTDSRNISSLLPWNANVTLSENTAHLHMLRTMPGYAVRDIPSDCKAVLMDSYHSGTICITPDLRRLCLEAKEREIPIYLTGLTEGVAHYETVAVYRELGISPLLNRSFTSQYCKLWLSLSNHLDLHDVMLQSVAEEKAMVNYS